MGRASPVRGGGGSLPHGLNPVVPKRIWPSEKSQTQMKNSQIIQLKFDLKQQKRVGNSGRLYETASKLTRLIDGIPFHSSDQKTQFAVAMLSLLRKQDESDRRLKNLTMPNESLKLI